MERSPPGPIGEEFRVLPYARADARAFGRTPRILLAIAWAYPLLPLGVVSVRRVNAAGAVSPFGMR